jgi:hypothetical protein
MRALIPELQTIYSEREPYIYVQKLGADNLIVFDSVFIDLLMLAFDTDCIAEMSEFEFELLNNFVAYEDGTYSDSVVQALDVWLVNLVHDIDNPTIEECN